MRSLCVLLLALVACVFAGDTHLTKQQRARSERRARSFANQCWDLPADSNSALLATSFLEETRIDVEPETVHEAAKISTQEDKQAVVKQVRSMCSAAKEYEAQSGKSVLNDEQRKGCEAVLNVRSPDLFSGYDANLYGPLWNAFPKMAGALFGRSVFSGCKCEACVYSLDTLIMYLDEDTLGFFNENDINRVLMDRFCYGLKWMYRSACHHIMSDYYPQVMDMLQKYLTGWDVCRHLRFCPWSLTNQSPAE